jgi:predicted metal-dependent peptidase
MLDNDPIVSLIVRARVGLLFSAPFFGNLATRMDLVQADSWCNTAATDGRNFYYNREFIKSLSPDELLFLMGHEVLHMVYDHLGRKGTRDHKIWNMANDYIVNYTLVREKIGRMPKMGLYDEKYTDEMTSEEVYRLLEKNSVKIQLPLDMHLDLVGGDGNSNKDGSERKVSVTVMGDGNGPPKITDEDLQRIRNEIKSAVINTAQSLGAGKVPLGVRRLLEAFSNPKMDWRTLLELHIQSQVKDDFTFQRPSKRSWSSGRIIIMPGQNLTNKIKLACFLDLSGSITDDMIRDFLGEVRGIMQTFEDFDLLLATFDTKVYNPKIFTPENLDELIDYEAKGGGGTLFECVFDFMKDPGSADPAFADDFPEPIEPPKMVMFTDGYPNGTWGDENYCDTLFVIVGNNHIDSPYGMSVLYDHQKIDA